MKTEFKLVGLGRPLSMTCEPIDKEDCFWPKVGLTQDRFNALWDYKKDHWNGSEKMIAVIEHDGLDGDGFPLNGVVVEVKILSV